ncbi:superoxide dismutase family protein [Legionella worsleiensis]|uniref:Superoxide dismutase [Cu-Zn] n=1 Tax=Legionella worsleiensis TaxID=45076 RepID=A0A0W1AHI9_9GAMM|nr:superoxide dismutase family protein [Legionella worsleiensis]KTD80761.1 superoxide dismutase [Cu-Zn] precursor [Legionella worsleiensis]STY32660.1 Cu/Zn superoxide dismutase [Legionella worsleiensis]
MNTKFLLIFASLLSLNIAQAAQMTASISTIGASSNPIGTVVFTETPYGVLIKPELSGLTPGLHGFHLHQHSSCAADGMDAGGHYDPANTNSHQGPYGNGHLGDLPVLYVSADGVANTPTLAPRLKLGDLKGLSVMVHANGDNYSDTPPMGGGGARIACGVIK